MSKSKSSQQSTVNTHHENNVLDGGAIKDSFKFASDVSDEAFDSVNDAVRSSNGVASDAVDLAGDVTSKALDANTSVIDEAFDKYESLSKGAFDVTQGVTSSALNKFAEQNNKSLDSLAMLQGGQATANFELLKGIQSTVKSSNSGGASDVLENQKAGFVVVGVVVVVLVLAWMFKGK